MTGHVIAVASGKGGVGKTTTVANLGMAMHRADQSVVVIDSDLGMPNLANVLGLDPAVTIHDVLADEATLDEALIEIADGFAVLAGERDLQGFADAKPANLQSVIADLVDRFTYVVIDTGAGLSYEALLPLELVDETILVTTADDSSTGDTARTAAFVDRVGGTIRGVVVTRTDSTTDPTAIATRFGTDLLGVIPNDPVVRSSTTAGEPLATYAPDSTATVAYDCLAGVLIEDADPYLGETDRASTTESQSDDGGESATDTPGDAEPGIEEESSSEPAAAEPAGVESEETTPPPKPGFFGRITRVFKK